MSDYSELKMRAAAATPGPWIEQDDEDSAAGAVFIVPESSVWVPPICRITSERDAAYVAAANPHEILGSIAEIDQLKAELECARGDLRQAMQIVERQNKALIDVREALGREYWDQYAGLDETRDILDAAIAAGITP